MMENLRLWLTALVVTVFMVAALERITPEAGAKRILRFASALLLLLVLLRPLTGGVNADRQTTLRYFRTETERLQEQYAAENRFRTEALIREKTEAYIETRAAEQGLSVQAEVQLRWNGEIPEIEAVLLRGGEDSDFEKSVTAALGIDEGCIRWEEGDK